LFLILKSNRTFVANPKLEIDIQIQVQFDYTFQEKEGQIDLLLKTSFRNENFSLAGALARR